MESLINFFFQKHQAVKTILPALWQVHGWHCLAVFLLWRRPSIWTRDVTAGALLADCLQKSGFTKVEIFVKRKLNGHTMMCQVSHEFWLLFLLINISENEYVRNYCFNFS